MKVIKSVVMWFRSLFSSRHIARVCGHRTRRIGKMTVGERSFYMTMPRNDVMGVDYCLDCLSSMSIQCAWCGEWIVIGDPITLYSPKPGYKMPKHAVLHNKDTSAYVGCLGWHCAETGGDRAGFWMPVSGELSAHVQRVPTALEMLLENPGKGVIIGNMQSPQDKGVLFDV